MEPKVSSAQPFSEYLTRFARRIATDKKGEVKAARCEKEIGYFLQESIDCGSAGVPLLAMAKDILSIAIALESFNRIADKKDPSEPVWLARMQTILRVVKRAMPCDYGNDEISILVEYYNPDLRLILERLAKKDYMTVRSLARSLHLKTDVALEDLSTLNQYGLVQAIMSNDVEQLRQWLLDLAKIPYALTGEGDRVLEMLGLNGAKTQPPQEKLATVTDMAVFRKKKHVVPEQE